jgi:hypothetical protein
MNRYNIVKVFSATKAADRAILGERVTEWLRNNPKIDVVGKFITQSSDNAFHCISVTLLCKTGVCRIHGDLLPCNECKGLERLRVKGVIL